MRKGHVRVTVSKRGKAKMRRKRREGARERERLSFIYNYTVQTLLFH